MAKRIHIPLPEVGVELVYELDAKISDNLIEERFEIARDTAELFTLESHINSLMTKRDAVRDRLLERTGHGIRYITKRHGRKKLPKTAGVYVDWEFDLEKARTQLQEAGRLDIFEQAVCRQTPGRFVAFYKEGDRDMVLHDIELAVERFGVEVKPFLRQEEPTLHYKTLQRLCFEDQIQLRGVKSARYTVQIYDRKPAESRK